MTIKYPQISGLIIFLFAIALHAYSQNAPAHIPRILPADTSVNLTGKPAGVQGDAPVNKPANSGASSAQLKSASRSVHHTARIPVGVRDTGEFNVGKGSIRREENEQPHR